MLQYRTFRVYCLTICRTCRFRRAGDSSDSTPTSWATMGCSNNVTLPHGWPLTVFSIWKNKAVTSPPGALQQASVQRLA